MSTEIDKVVWRKTFRAGVRQRLSSLLLHLHQNLQVWWTGNTYRLDQKHVWSTLYLWGQNCQSEFCCTPFNSFSCPCQITSQDIQHKWGTKILWFFVCTGHYDSETTSPFAYLILRDFPELIWTKQLSGWPWGAYPQPTGNLSHPSAIKSYMLVLCFLEHITIHIHNPQCNLSYPNFWSQSHHTVHAKIIFQHFDTWTLSTQLHSILEKVKTKEWWYWCT